MWSEGVRKLYEGFSEKERVRGGAMLRERELRKQNSSRKPPYVLLYLTNIYKF